MSLTRDWYRIVLIIALVAITTGCASTSQAESVDAVMCPKCETVWVEYLDSRDPYRMEYTSGMEMQCPDCRSAVATFFTTGDFQHSCATCGDVLIHCTAHRSSR